MTFHKAMIIAAAICFGLAAFGIPAAAIALPLLGMCFFALAFF